MVEKKVLWGLLVLSVLLYFSRYFLVILNSDALGQAYQFIYLVSIILLLNIPILIILSYSEQNSLNNKAKKVLIATILLGIITLIGAALVSYIFFGWGEVGYVLIFTIIFGGPVLGIIYAIGVIIGIIGLFKVKEKESLRKNIIILSIVVLLIVVGISLVAYNSNYFSYKRQFSNYLEDIPIYSNNGECETIKYEVKTDTWGTKYYNLICEYNSVYPLNETYIKHHSYLTKNNWRFPWDNLGLEYFLNQDQSMEYSKSDNNNFPRLDVYYNEYPKIRLTISNY
ncbi:hypothetical protein J4466_00205 [Candidatus Pacearchaeota archaeon]|nr:hypothetical protein [Candidatus Pacearchaeota archaeon]